MAEVLNPGLYAALSSWGDAGISNAGEPRRVRYFPNHRYPKRPRVEVVERGEEYQINCPCCGDRRRRLSVNQCYGIPDRRAGTNNRHLLHCYNQKCHLSRRFQKMFWSQVCKAGYNRKVRLVIPAPTEQKPKPPIAISLPAPTVPLHLLPRDHPACNYLSSRGFNPVDLAIRWGVTYCEHAPDSKPEVKRRIVVPICAIRADPSANNDYREPETVLMGWQARSIDDLGGSVKYLSASGLKRNNVLYGLAEALPFDVPLVLVEGVTDCWRYGTGAVAIFGKKTQLSRHQVRQLNQFAPGRPIVILLDRDAHQEARSLRQQLRTARAIGNGDNRVVLASLPDSVDDPGDATRKELQHCVAEALGEPDKTITQPPYRIMDGARRYFSEKGLARLGGSIVVSYTLTPTTDNAIAVSSGILIGEDEKLRIIATGIKRTAESVSVHRVYHESLPARVFENRHGITPPSSYDDIDLMAKLIAVATGCNVADVHKKHRPAIPPHLAACASSLQPPLRETVRTAIETRVQWDGGNLASEIDRLGLRYVYQDVELPVVAPTAAMMASGVLIDVPKLRAKAKQVTTKPTLHSTAESLLRHVDRKTNRVFCKLDPMGTETGRFTCSVPNLQGLLKELRDTIVAPTGSVLLEADFSQIELRVLAELSKDERLTEAICRGDDLHCHTASSVFQIPPDEVTTQQRQIGKTINFAIVFGVTAFGLAERLEMPESKAEELIDSFFRMHPGVANWMDGVRDCAKRDGYVTTLYGRRRALQDVTSTNPHEREHALRQAVNTTVQGTAADINKLALSRLYRQLPSRCKMIMTVHDSVLLEVHTSQADECVRLVRDVMEQLPPRFSVPMGIEVSTGRNWLACK